MFDKILADLAPANRQYLATYPGENSARQPVHTVYGGAQIFSAETAAKMREVAIKSFQDYADSPKVLRDVFQLESHDLAHKVHLRVADKLAREAVEDFRIDFEDGFGVRPEAEEDAEAVRAAKEVARGAKAGSLPPYLGIRIKSLGEELKPRALRTMELFITTLAADAKPLPSHFVVTLPKITHVQQIHACVAALELLESKTGLPPGSIPMELMVETPQTIFGYAGEVSLPAFVAACKGRCRGAHFGTYDYTASMSVTADHQRMDHPACDFARNVMKVSLAGTGVWLSDGATNIMPVPVHKIPRTEAEREENRKAVHDAWRINYAHIQHSLVNGYYQGWDLHPAQLPVRYTALYSFFLGGFDATARRLRLFVDQAAKATLLGNVFDDAATGQGLLNYFLRGLSCGAITESEVAATGLTLDEIRTRSFKKILETRVKG